MNRYADFSMLHRSISRDYISLYGSAFTQSTTPVNENGFYTGINIKPNDVLRIDAYADIFSFPWLRYRVDAPSSGSEYMIQLNYRPNRNSEFYLRYRKTDKAINTIFPDLPLSYVGNKSRESKPPPNEAPFSLIESGCQFFVSDSALMQQKQSFHQAIPCRQN